MSTRRKARETALKIFYSVDIKQFPKDGVVSGMEELAEGTEVRRYCEAIVSGVIGNRVAIDSLIEGNSDNWTIERMPIVDRNILRVAVYELVYRDDIPFKVVIDEAVELAKRYGSDESSAFINGVLDNVHRNASEKKTAAE